MLYQLSKYQLIGFLNDWADEKMLSSLDMALCNRNHRDKFLSALASVSFSKCVIFNCGELCSIRSLKWVSDRKVKIQKFSVRFSGSRILFQPRLVPSFACMVSCFSWNKVAPERYSV